MSRSLTRWVALAAATPLFFAACGTRVERSGGLAQPQVASHDLAAEAPEPGAVAPGATGSIASPGADVTSPTVIPTARAGHGTSPVVAERPQGAAASPAQPSVSAGGATPGTSPGQSSGTAPRTSVPGSPSQSVPEGPAPPGSTITVGTLGTFSGPVGEILKATVEGIAVWIRWTNDRGGVNGHPIKQIVADDGGDPARHRALEKELVETRGIQAFLYKWEGFAGLNGADPYVVERQIPVIGTGLIFEWDYQSPFYFPYASSGEAFNVAAYLGAASELLVPQGKRRLGSMVCVESTACTQGEKVWARDAAAWGFESVYQSRVSLAQPDFTAECLGAQRAGVEVMFFGFDDKTASRVATSCTRQNFRPIYALSAQAASPTMLQNPSLDGMLVGTLTFPWPANDTPAQREFRGAFAKYLPGKTPIGTHALGWVNGKMFEAGLSALPAAATREAILQGMWSIKNEDLGGLSAPLTFHANGNAERRICWSTVQVKGGKFTVVGGSTLRCKS